MPTEGGPEILRVGVSGAGGSPAPWEAATIERLAGVPGVLVTVLPEGAFASSADGGGLDLVLRFGGPPPPGTPTPRLGIWMFLLGPEGRRGMAPPGWWEIRLGEPVAEAALVRLEGQGERGRVIRRAAIRTRERSLTATGTELQRRLARWPAQACASLLAGAEPGGEEETAIAWGADGSPGLVDAGLAVARVGVNRVRLGVRSLVRRDHWNVGVVRAPITAFLGNERPAVAWLPPPGRGSFIADPFGAEEDGRLTLLCEWLEYGGRERGRIVAVDPFADPETRTPVPLGPPVHHSYPYVFRHDGAIWCVPETSEAHEVVLYRAEQFPTRWRRVATLLADVSALDATLFQYDGRWWLAHGDADEGEHDDLCLWHAPALEGPWRPHRANPVKTDARSGRPAGTPFVHEGVLYRPAQDCSLDYGRRVAINRVLRLTPEVFEERPVAWVEPDPLGPWPDGLHTLTAVGPYTLVDGKRLAFSWVAGLTSARRSVLKYLGLRQLAGVAPSRTRI